jgi:hypothetical protein
MICGTMRRSPLQRHSRILASKPSLHLIAGRDQLERRRNRAEQLSKDPGYFVTAGFAASAGTGIGMSVAIFHPSPVLIQSSTMMNGAGLGYPP